MSFVDEWQGDPVIAAARAKLGELPEDFRMYEAGWLGDIKGRGGVLEVKGCCFRAAKSGPRKGQLVIPIRGTEKVAYLTCDEVDNAKETK